MTEPPVLMKKVRARATTECPLCRTMTKNLGAHQRGASCQASVTGVDRDVVIRAGAHGASEHTLPPVARFQGRTTDLDIARLLRQLEGGMVVFRGGDSWFTEPAPYPSRHLAMFVREALRTGLVAEIGERLVPAPVHARAVGHPTEPACGVNALRWRLLSGADLRLVDCTDCLDLPLSAVSYSTHDD